MTSVLTIRTASRRATSLWPIDAELYPGDALPGNTDVALSPKAGRRRSSAGCDPPLSSSFAETSCVLVLIGVNLPARLQKQAVNILPQMPDIWKVANANQKLCF